MNRSKRFGWVAVLLSLGLLLVLPFVLQASKSESEVLIAHLSRGDTSGLAAIRDAFVARNPGYDLEYLSRVAQIPAGEQARVVFVQEGRGTISLSVGESSEVDVGDIVMLGAGESLRSDSLLSLLVFEVSDSPPENIPAFVRPDWDPRITDVLGGCATDSGAYRRILLTWQESVGPYVYHALNAHRVRITDSFSHYHPEDGGFDEFYLVQMVQSNAKLFTSEKLDRISDPENVDRDEAGTLLEEHDVEVGDLVYLPRGVVHRGFGGVLAQVITVPGFVPGTEIGVDHHLRAINERLGLQGADTVPFHWPTSDGPVVR